jgi:hypothetical protein
MPLTLEERERLAYINGDTEAADLLGELIDAQAQLDEMEDADYPLRTDNG